jgi:hypothetical protein
MWLISRYGFASVVEHLDKPDWVLVRSRSKSDLEEFCLVARDCDVPGFSEDAIEENSDADYRFRMTVKNEDWAELAKVLAVGIDYPNFKNVVASVDPERAAIYSTVWADLMKIQFPASDNWVDRGGADRGENVARLYRMAAEHLQDRLDEYTGNAPIPEDALGEALDPPALPEQFDNDPAAMLEYRMIQRIGIGFWQQAGGYGFDKLRAAIEAAKRASALKLTDSDWVPPDDGEQGPEHVAVVPPRLIPNASLQQEQVPSYYLGGLDPVGFNCGVVDPQLGGNTKEWKDLWTFALTFDGYGYFGGDDGALERLGRFAESVEESFLATGQLPSLDLAMLRACLFVQQRHWLKWGGVMTRSCPPESVKYLDALLRAIRSQL